MNNLINFIIYLFLKILCFYLRVLVSCYYWKWGTAQSMLLKNLVSFEIPIQYITTCVLLNSMERRAWPSGFDSHRGHMSEWFFRSNRPGSLHPVSSELENSGIRVVVSDCGVTECRRWRLPYQTGKTVHVHAKHNEEGRTAPGVCGNGSVRLNHSGNVVMRIGLNTHTLNSMTHWMDERRPILLWWIRSSEIHGVTLLRESEHNNN